MKAEILHKYAPHVVNENKQSLEEAKSISEKESII